jgi:hypothetical protein
MELELVKWESGDPLLASIPAQESLCAPSEAELHIVCEVGKALGGHPGSQRLFDAFPRSVSRGKMAANARRAERGLKKALEAARSAFDDTTM